MTAALRDLVRSGSGIVHSVRRVVGPVLALAALSAGAEAALIRLPRPASAVLDASVLCLPLAETGNRGIRLDPATRQARTATALARTRTATSLAHTLTPATTSVPTHTVAPSPSPSYTPRSEATLTATPEPTRSATPRDISADRLRPSGADRDAGAPEVVYDASRRTWRLRGSAASAIAYEVDLTHPDVARGRLSIREVGSGRYPISGAGLYYRTLAGALVEPWLTGRLGAVEAVEAERLLGGDGIRVTVRETLEGAAHAKRFTLRPVGRSLWLHAESLDPPGEARGSYAGFTAGDIAGANDAVDVHIPYMDAVPVTMLDHRWFASTLLDLTTSAAAELAPRGPAAIAGGFSNEVVALYPPDAGGRVAPVDEQIWLTLSPVVQDTFAVPVQSPSPHRSRLLGRAYVTLTGRAPDVTFADDVAYLERLADWGMRALVVTKLHWRDDRVPRPAQGPPDPLAGGAPGFAALAAAAEVVAWSQAYTETVEACPGEENPRFRSEDRLTDADGAPKRLLDEVGGTRDCPGGGVAGRYLLAPDAALDWAIAYGEAGAGAGVGAIHLDTLTAWNPAYAWPGAADNAIDRAPDAAHPDTVAGALAAYKRLFAALQVEVGPVIGPGAYGAWYAGCDSFFAGYVDGVSRSLSTGSDEQPFGDGYLVIPDYELHVARQRMVNYGMGPYARFFEGYPPGGEVPEPLMDEWRATELAYGHAGAWEAGADPDVPDPLTPADTLKEYVIMTTLVGRAADAAPPLVRYVEPDGSARDLSWALAHDFDLSAPRLYLDYGALAFWINHSTTDWAVDLGGTPLVLPTHGWLVRGDDGLTGYSALVDGQRVDWLDAPDVSLLDGRGRVTHIGAMTARDLLVAWRDGPTIEEGPDGVLRRVP